MKISDHMTAIGDALRAAPDLAMVNEVKVTPGRFDASEITKRSFKAPALRVAFLGAPKSQGTADGTRRYDVALAVFVLTDGRERETEGVDIAQAVAELIELNRFSDGSGIGLPTNLRMDALYSGSVDDKGISLYSVSWTQTMRLGASAGIAAASDPDAIIAPNLPLDAQIDITVLPEGN